MKISFFTIISVFSVAGAAEHTNLRPIVEEVSDLEVPFVRLEGVPFKSSEKLLDIGTQVMVRNVREVPDEDAASTLSNCFVSAFNGADMAGFKMVAFSADDTVDVPEPDDEDEEEGLTGKHSKRRRSSWGSSNYWGCSVSKCLACRCMVSMV